VTDGRGRGWRAATLDPRTLTRDTSARMAPRPTAPRPAELLVSDTIGRLIEFWGFKRNMGRVWAMLYLSDVPLSSKELRERLKLSSGAVSMTLTELSRWGVVRKVWIQGARRDHFTAEGNLWKMVSRVIRERELTEITDAIASLEDAIRMLDEASRGGGDAATRAQAVAQRARVRRLLELARLGRSLVEALVSSGRIDAAPLVKFLLGARA